MYVLCKESPSTKKTPLIYEVDRRGICPVCGEAIKTSMFDLTMKGVTYTTGHVISKNPDLLMLEKKLIMADRTLKGATT